MAEANRRVVVRAYPADLPGPEHFTIETAPVPVPAEGQALVRTVWLGMDPFPRMQLTDRPGGPPAIPLGSVMIGRGVARVVESRRPDLTAGDWVVCDPGWQDYALYTAAETPRKLDPDAAPPSAALGLLGPSGLTAYFTLSAKAGVKAGETVVVTAAAGSVGSAACQIARTLGARVVGIAGGAEQIAFLTHRLRVDAAVDWQAEPDLAAALRAACPDGIHAALDTVGGATHDAIMANIAVGGRVVMAGFISGYGERKPYGNPHAIIFRRATLMGFLLADHMADAPAALDRLAGWHRAGSLELFENLTIGLENAPAAFAGLFRSPPPGKQLVRVEP